MRDEMDMRLLDEHRGSLWTTLSDVGGSIAHTLDRLHAILFDAPWRDDTNRCA